MPPKSHSPTFEPTQKSTKNNESTESKTCGESQIAVGSIDATMASSRGSDKARDKTKKSSHRSSRGSSVNRRPSQNPKTSISGRHTSSQYENESLGARRRHRRASSHHSGESSSSDEEENEEEPVEDHRLVLAEAKGNIATPSVFSMMTSLTTATDGSGGSSGSNSTVTQASVSRKSQTRKAALEESPLSPAAPDPPDVFAYMVEEYEEEEDEEEDDDDDQDGCEVDLEHGEKEAAANEEDDQLTPMWSSPAPQEPYFPPPLMLTGEGSITSSVSSSFNDDSSSERQGGGNDTDRSSSPERSAKGSPPMSPKPATALKATESPPAPPSPAEAKFAAHEKAARHRQNLHHGQPHRSSHRSSRGPPQYQAGRLPHSGTPSPTHPLQVSMFPDHKSEQENEEREAWGYNLLASALTVASPTTPNLPPIYRKFTTLSHRYLLHLQDELSECEEQLQKLDRYRLETRDPATGEILVHPGSRRSPYDIDHHRSELLHLAGHKLKLYQDALKGMESIEGDSGLKRAKEGEIEKYRNFLDHEHPIVDEETRFLDHKEDLVVVGQPHHHRHSSHTKQKSVRFDTRTTMPAAPTLPGLATAIAAAVLVPILTFVVIPGFLGRMTVALLVSGGIVGAIVQSGGMRMDLISREGATCAVVYAIGMAIVACVVG